jgi:hypothetical protein
MCHDEVEREWTRQAKKAVSELISELVEVVRPKN